MKTCLKCNKELIGIKGPKKRCDNCNKEHRKLYLKEREKKTNRKQQNKERLKRFRENNPEKIKEYNKKYRKKIESKQKKKERNKKYYIENLEHKLGNILRYRLWYSLKRESIEKNLSSMTLVGCTKEELIKYIESKFQEGMTWENWSMNGWHIDHIRPIASFDLSDPQQLHECFHYTNLQPLWAEDNLKKSDLWDGSPRDNTIL